MSMLLRKVKVRTGEGRKGEGQKGERREGEVKKGKSKACESAEGATVLDPLATTSPAQPHISQSH